LEDINEFQSFISGNSWNHFSALGVIYKRGEKWEIVHVRIVLEISKSTIRTNLIEEERIRFFHTNIKFSEFNKFWSALVEKRIFLLDGIEADTQLLTCPMSFYVKPKEQIKDYSISENAYYMLWSGNQTISNFLPDIDEVIRESDGRYNNLKHACNLNLGITFGSGSYSPHLVVIAPLYVSLGTLNLDKKGNLLISVDYQCKERLNKSRVKVYCTSLNGQAMSEATNYNNNVKIVYPVPKGYDNVVIELRYSGLKYLLESKSIPLRNETKTIDMNQMKGDTSINYPDTNISNLSSAVHQPFLDNVDEAVDCPNLRTRLIDSLSELNNFSKTIFGVKLFKTDAKFFQPIEKSCIKLSRDSTNREEFINVLLSLAFLIDSITQEARDKALKEFNEKGDHSMKKPERSISQIAFLFQTEELPDSTPFKPLKSIYSIRNKTPPIHNGESETIKLLKEFDIHYPITDYQNAARKMIEAYLTSIINLRDILKKHYENKFDMHNRQEALE